MSHTHTHTHTLCVADAQVHHCSWQVSSAAAPADVGVPAVVVRVQRRGERGGKLQVAEVGQGAPGTQRALVVGQPGVLLWRWEYAAGKADRTPIQRHATDHKPKPTRLIEKHCHSSLTHYMFPSLLFPTHSLLLQLFPNNSIWAATVPRLSPDYKANARLHKQSSSAPGTQCSAFLISMFNWGKSMKALQKLLLHSVS